MSISSTGLSRDERKVLNNSAGMRPLAVAVKTARALLGVGNTTMWQLIKDGRVKTVSIGRRRLVIYASLESLLTPEAGGAS